MSSHESNLTTTPATEPFYPRRREDGWPYCPGCGADNLWGPSDDVAAIVVCLACDWKPGFAREAE